jgi:tRNA(fMet)-specific endonuclease VapC
MKPEDLTSDALLVDTDVFSRLADADPAYEGFRAFTHGRYLFIAFVTVGEVLAGARAKDLGPKRLALIESSFQAYGVLPGNAAVARTYGHLWALLKNAGRPVGTNDLWIASVALSQDPPLPLLTNDRGFENIASVSDLILVGPDR